MIALLPSLSLSLTPQKLFLLDSLKLSITRVMISIGCRIMQMDILAGKVARFRAKVHAPLHWHKQDGYSECN